jgi:hypothetical protein
MVISEPTPFVAGRFEKPLRFASNQQMQINIFSFFKKKKTYSCRISPCWTDSGAKLPPTAGDFSD